MDAPTPPPGSPHPHNMDPAQPGVGKTATPYSLSKQVWDAMKARNEAERPPSRPGGDADPGGGTRGKSSSTDPAPVRPTLGGLFQQRPPSWETWEGDRTRPSRAVIESLTEAQWRAGSSVHADVKGTALFKQAGRRAVHLMDRDTEADLRTDPYGTDGVRYRWADLREAAKQCSPADLNAIDFSGTEPRPPCGSPLSFVGYAFLANWYADQLEPSEREALLAGWLAACAAPE